MKKKKKKNNKNKQNNKEINSNGKLNCEQQTIFTIWREKTKLKENV